MKRVCDAIKLPVCVGMKLAVCAGVFLLCGCSQHVIQDVPVKKGEVVGGYVVTPEDTMIGQVKQQRAIAKKQEDELKKQQDEIDDLRRQQYENERLRQYIDRTHADAPSK